MTTYRTSGRLAAFAGAAALLIASFVQPAAARNLFDPEHEWCILTTNPEIIQFTPDNNIPLPNVQPPIGTLLAPVVRQTLTYSCGPNTLQMAGHKGNTGYSFDIGTDSGILNDDLYDDGTNVVFESGIAGVGLKIVVASITADYAQATDHFWGEPGPTAGFDLGQAYKANKDKDKRVQIAPASALVDKTIGGTVVIEYSLVSTDRYVQNGKPWGADVGGSGRVFLFAYTDAAFWDDSGEFVGYGNHCRNFVSEWYKKATGGEQLRQRKGCANYVAQTNRLASNIIIHSIKAIPSTCALSWGGEDAIIGGPYKGAYTVELREVSADEFGGKGSTAGSKEVSLGFTCPFQKGRGYLLKMSDLNDSTSDGENALSLARDTPEPAAAGVGIQIRLKNREGSEEVLKTNRNSSISMAADRFGQLHKGRGNSLIVEYIKTTTDPIKPGNVKADALLSIVFK